MTYHYNNGNGSTPGTIALKHSDGTTYGPWSASGTTQNQYWTVTPNVTIKAGTYTVVDSNTTTWSYNSSSKNAGFVQIEGDAVTTTTTTTTTSSTPVKVTMTANGSKSISVSTSTPVKLDIAVDPGSNTTRADWWLVYAFGDKVFWLDPVAGFTSKIVPALQMNLFSIPTTTIMNTALPAGNHIYCLAVDQKADAQLTAASLDYDYASIAVTSSSTGGTSSGSPTSISVVDNISALTALTDVAQVQEDAYSELLLMFSNYGQNTLFDTIAVQDNPELKFRCRYFKMLDA